MSNIRAIIEEKGRNTHTIGATNTVFEAVCKMVHHNLGALVVVESGQVIGIITERDYLRKVAVEGRSSKSTFVAEIMTKDPICIRPNVNANHCLKLMADHSIRHIPVLEEGTLIGVIAVRDIVNHLAREKDQTIDELTHYIQGSYA